MAKPVARAAMIFCAAVVPGAVMAQARQPFSLQGSLLYTAQQLGAGGSVGGAGAELQARYNPSQYSIGMGLQYSHHTSDDATLDLTGLFLEPRVAIDVGSNRVAPYLAGRIVLLRQSSTIGTVPKFSSYGNAFGAGGGLLIHLTSRVNFDAGAAYLRQTLGDKSFANGARVDFPSFNGYVAKAGITFGIGQR